MSLVWLGGQHHLTPGCYTGRHHGQAEGLPKGKEERRASAELWRGPITLQRREVLGAEQQPCGLVYVVKVPLASVETGMWRGSDSGVPFGRGCLPFRKELHLCMLLPAARVPGSAGRAGPQSRPG